MPFFDHICLPDYPQTKRLYHRPRNPLRTERQRPFQEAAFRIYKWRIYEGPANVLSKSMAVAALQTYLQPVCCDSHDVGQKEGEVKAARGGSLAGCNLFSLESFVAIFILFTVL